jgi:outer membrane protein TolC
VNFRSAESQLAVVQRSFVTRTETLQLTQWREQAGTGTALDTQQARTIVEQAKSAIPALQLQATQSRNLLALLAGQTPGFYDRSLVKSRAVPLLSPPGAMGIPADTLRQRPDVRASEAAVLAATARTMSAERERLPAFQLTGSLGAESGSGRAFFSPQTTLASLAGGLTAPIFQAGRIRNKILMQTEQQRQAFSAYEATVLRALSEVENALAAVQRYKQQAQSIQSSITAATEAERLAALQYKAGQIDLFLSLDTQRTLLSLQQQQVSTMTQQATASIQLYKALGGGWSKN